jgi:hypothetical protein
MKRCLCTDVSALVAPFAINTATAMPAAKQAAFRLSGIGIGQIRSNFYRANGKYCSLERSRSALNAPPHPKGGGTHTASTAVELSKQFAGEAMALRSNNHPAPDKSVSLVSFDRKWKMVGKHGQQLGEVGTCGIDLVSGRVLYLVLDTPWQALPIPWQSVSVDATTCRFRLRSGAP